MTGYAVQTLEIEIARLRRAIRALESRPGRHVERVQRLSRYVDELGEALRAMRGPESPDGRMEGFPAYALETLRVEEGRLMQVIRALYATPERGGVRYPAERIAVHQRWLEEIREAIPQLERALEARVL